MEDQELVRLATALLMTAKAHEGLSVCVNPGHTHTLSPCEEHCMDHMHQCNQGCGEWPCKTIQLGDVVAKYLNDLQTIQIAYQQTIVGLNLARVNLQDELENNE